jgi:hypothetical protein
MPVINDSLSLHPGEPAFYLPIGGGVVGGETGVQKPLFPDARVWCLLLPRHLIAATDTLRAFANSPFLWAGLERSSAIF